MKHIIKDMTLADRLLLLLLITASLAGIFISKEAMSRTSDVIIEIDGKPSYTFSLDADKTAQVTGPHGSAVVEIRDRKVRVREADCPNRLCVRQGWISSGVIVCLPAKIVVFVGGKVPHRSNDIDAVTG